MQPRTNWRKITIKAVIGGLLWGIGFTWLFSLVVEDGFVQILPIGMGCGVLLVILLFFLMTVPYKIVAISVAFQYKEAFLEKLNTTFPKIGYRSKGEYSWEYERPGLDSYYCENISITIEASSVTIVGPKSPVRKLHKLLS